MSNPQDNDSRKPADDVIVGAKNGGAISDVAQLHTCAIP